MEQTSSKNAAPFPQGLFIAAILIFLIGFIFKYAAPFTDWNRLLDKHCDKLVNETEKYTTENSTDWCSRLDNEHCMELMTAANRCIPSGQTRTELIERIEKCAAEHSAEWCSRLGSEHCVEIIKAIKDSVPCWQPGLEQIKEMEECAAEHSTDWHSRLGSRSCVELVNAAKEGIPPWPAGLEPTVVNQKLTWVRTVKFLKEDIHISNTRLKILEDLLTREDAEQLISARQRHQEEFTFNRDLKDKYKKLEFHIPSISKITIELFMYSALFNYSGSQA